MCHRRLFSNQFSWGGGVGQKEIPRPLADNFAVCQKYKGTHCDFCWFFLPFWLFHLISYVAQEKLSIIRIIRIIIRIMPKSSVIRIKLFFIRTNTPTANSAWCLSTSVIERMDGWTDFAKTKYQGGTFFLV
jgi:hypothetical protein